MSKQSVKSRTPGGVRSLAALTAILAGLGATACERRQAPVPAPAATPAPPPAPPAEPAHFVGSAVCAECHADVADRWRGSAHARAMQKATPDTVLGRFAGAPFRDG